MHQCVSERGREGEREGGVEKGSSFVVLLRVTTCHCHRLEAAPIQLQAG